MILAEMEYPQEYWEFHSVLDTFIRSKFDDVQSGIQADSWIWIAEGEDKVAIDTFSSTKHQVKASNAKSPLAQRVMGALLSEFKLRVYAEPELEAHEGD